MKNLLRILCIAAAAVALLTATLILLLAYPPQKATQELVLSAREPVDIVSVTVRNANGSFTVSSESGGYVVSGLPSELVDIDAFIGFMTNSAYIRAVRKIQRAGRGQEAYGLENPAASVSVRYNDGAGITLLIGAKEEVSGDYYAAAGQKDEVYLLPAESAETFLIAKEKLLSFAVTPALRVSSALSALQNVRFSGGGLAQPVLIESVSAGDEAVRQLARSFGAPTHIVRSAGVYELDQSYGIRMLAPLCGMTAKMIYRYGLTPEQEDQTGFGEPHMLVEFDYANGSAEAAHYALRLLPANDDQTLFFANVRGSGVIYVIERPPFVDLQFEKLLLRWFLSPLLMDVRGITVESDGGITDFSIDQTDLKNPVVQCRGETVDIALFRRFFALLGGAAADGNYLGAQEMPDGAPVLTITYHYTEEKPDDVLALYPGAMRRVLAFVNGVCEFAMKDTFVPCVQAALPALLEGREFDNNW